MHCASLAVPARFSAGSTAPCPQPLGALQNAGSANAAQTIHHGKTHAAPSASDAPFFSIPPNGPTP
ncbi:MAG: hypothetical protein ACN6O1_20270 [Comamonas sp.]|uniref:hypothetical protein n=1 Tax=Comamonas sp. TaxID=34028 RepID=UPI003D09C7EB